jgi:hypothetical protein
MDLERRTRRRAFKAAPMSSAIFSRNYVTSKTLFRLSLVTLMIALTGVFASLARAADAPAAKMQGGCGDYKWDMSAEFAAWAATPMQVESGRNENEAPAVEMGKRYDLTLRSHESVQFATAPEKDRGGPGKSSGLLKFTPKDAGLYRISASTGLWIDVVQFGARVASDSFQMQTKCETIFKSVAFRLKGGQPHIIQLNGSPLKTAGLLITKVKE